MPAPAQGIYNDLVSLLPGQVLLAASVITAGVSSVQVIPGLMGRIHDSISNVSNRMREIGLVQHP